MDFRIKSNSEDCDIIQDVDDEVKPPMNPLAADAKEALLAWFLGIFGAHKFYRKKYFMGILYLLTFGLLSAGAFADGIWLTYAFCAKADGKPIKKQVNVIAWVVGILIPTLLIGGWLLTKPQPQQPVPVAAETVETTVATEPETVPTTVQTEPETTELETAATMAPVTQPAAYTTTYVLNTSSGKFHLPGCSSIKDMNEENKGTFTGTREQAIASGYEPCGNCNP